MKIASWCQHDTPHRDVKGGMWRGRPKLFPNARRKSAHTHTHTGTPIPPTEGSLSSDQERRGVTSTQAKELSLTQN